MYCRIQLPIGAAHPAPGPRRVLGTDQGRKYVFVVDDEGVVQRDVKVGALHDGLRVVEGLGLNERVVVEGLQQVRPKLKVNATVKGMPREKRPRTCSSPTALRRRAARSPWVSEEVGLANRKRQGVPVFSRFFIDRPIFASVLSIVITLAGGVAVFNLPVAQYPQITPPSIIVTCTYPGANAQVVAESVAAPIEQQVNGVEDMMYMSSQSTNDGSYSLTVTFKPGVNLNFAQVLVQNRVNLALPLLPDVVKQAGVTTRKRNPDILLSRQPSTRPTAATTSSTSATTPPSSVTDEIARVDGVGDVVLFGQQDYSMRVWVDPDQLAVAEPDGRRRGQRRPRAEHAGGGRPHRPAADRPPASRSSSPSPPSAG